MKNLFFLLLFSFFFFFKKGIGQSNPVLSKIIYGEIEADQYSKQFEAEYFYDEFGDTIQVNKTGFSFPNENSLVGFFYEYDDKKRVNKKLARRYNPDVDLWITITWEEFLYDDKDCLIQKKDIRNTPQSEVIYDYEVNDVCQFTQTIIDSSLIFYQTHEYFDSNNSNIVNDFYKENDDWELVGINTSIYNDQKDLTSRSNIFLTNGDTTFQQFWVNEYEYIFDPSSNLLSSKIIKTFHNSVTSGPVEFAFEQRFDYQYFCNGLIKEEKKYIDFIPNLILIKNYEYKGVNECFDKNQEIYLKIFPNPSNGIVNIQSGIFESGNTDIRIFSFDGKFIEERNIDDWGNMQEIDLSYLPSGVYILQVINQNIIKTTKLIIN